MLELIDVSFKYKDSSEILKNINLKIEDGNVICIIGKNGSGKSTLSKIMSGLLKPTNGKVLLDNIDIYNKKNIKEIRKFISVVFQNPENQILFDNVYDDLEFSLKNFKLDNIKNRIENALTKVDMLEFENANTYNLSLGQKQRINIASAISNDSKILIFDEPTSMIDSNGKKQIYKIIDNLKKEKKTIVFVTNNMDEILLADKIILISDNKINEISNVDELINNQRLINDSGIIIPEMIKLIIELRKNGIDIDLKRYSISDITERIIKNEKSI